MTDAVRVLFSGSLGGEPLELEKLSPQAPAILLNARDESINFETFRLMIRLNGCSFWMY